MYACGSFVILIIPFDLTSRINKSLKNFFYCKMPNNSSPEKFTFFYRKESPFSQFHPATFSSIPMDFGHENNDDATTATPTPPASTEPVQFLHCEMWMMFHKARLFRDEESAKNILSTPLPQKCKALGRKVKNFDQTIWSRHNKDIIYEGNRQKFTQNPVLMDQLLATKGTTLVEASPTDRLYGIGLKESDPRAGNRRTWLGRNLLGQVLTELRKDYEDKES